MNIEEFYGRSICIGIEADLRGQDTIEADLDALERAYDQLPTSALIGFDVERLTNPFGDTRLVYGDPNTEITAFVTGIDINEHAFQLVEKLRGEGKRVDAIVSHHTSGWELRNIEDVLSAQFHRIVAAGVSADVARRLMDGLAASKRQSWTRNHKLELAKQYDIPVLLDHTPADNCHLACTRALIEERQPGTMAEAIDVLSEVPEMGQIEGRGDGVRIVIGQPDAPLGKLFYAMGGGWNPSPAVLAALAEAGVNTAMMVTPGEPLISAAQAAGINIIGMPHEGQDSLGMSLLYSKVIGDEDITIYPCGGYLMLEEHFLQ